ncbi:MAG: mycofactocin-coupled SDR family oxidoreductase [Propionibacteriales bacterium]|nr:mycofactocin-coupled SDR family oxidoreductase [Propionibacteriales bacterium]
MDGEGRLSGMVALVTGAARGLGRAMAIRLARDGADVVGLDLTKKVEVLSYDLSTPDELSETGRRVEAFGRRSLMIGEVDVRELSAVRQAVDQALDTFGQIDIVCANAGISATRKLTWEIEEDEWQAMLDVNLTGVWHTVKAVVPAMLERDAGGAIIITSSVAGVRGTPYASAYVASKHGVVGLMRALANELGPHGVRVNSVAPSAADTPIARRPDLSQQVGGTDDVDALFRKMNLMPVGLLPPEDVADAVAWLASDEARYVTGAVLPVDAGTVVRFSS